MATSTNNNYNNTDSNNNNMEYFEQYHQEQLNLLNIPVQLYDGIQYQLELIFGTTGSTTDNTDINTVDDNKSNNNNNNNNEISSFENISSCMVQLLLSSSPSKSTDSIIQQEKQKEQQQEKQQQNKIKELLYQNPYGTIIVIPHICSWDMMSVSYQRELYDTIYALPIVVLYNIINSLNSITNINNISSSSTTRFRTVTNTDTNSSSIIASQHEHTTLANDIVNHRMFWSCIILYHDTGSSTVNGTRVKTIRAALPAPPYYPHYNVDTTTNETDDDDADDSDEADISGPFPFQYYKTKQPLLEHDQEHEYEQQQYINVSLGYISPGILESCIVQQHRLPTIDLVPSYQYPNNVLMRAVRYILLSEGIVSFTNKYVQIIKEYYATFVYNMHLVRQKKLEVLYDTNNEDTKNIQHTQQQDQQLNEDNRSIMKMNNDIKTVQVPHVPKQKLRVYTDTNDPMELTHPITGLEANSQYFTIVSDPYNADIIFSYQSLFSSSSNNNNNSPAGSTPSYNQLVQYRREQQQKMEQQQQQQQQSVENDQSTTSNTTTATTTTMNDDTILINQFPYEGAFVQKDHLAREVYNQHGLPRPDWCIESYDLDVHLPYFAGSILTLFQQQQEEDNEQDNEDEKDDNDNFVKQQQDTRPVWIVKPSNGTQSKGHIVTRSLAHIIRLIDCRGTNVVIQRYVENPICCNGHKIDCRVVVLMVPPSEVTSSSSSLLPTLYMHNTVYFRIAHKEHCISNEYNLSDHEIVLTATHLFTNAIRTSNDTIRKLPYYEDTIQQLEQIYGIETFDWYNKILPQIQIMICELFNGMATGYPAMMKSTNSRAVYGIDIIFEINEVTDDNDDDDYDDNTIITKDADIDHNHNDNDNCKDFDTMRNSRNKHQVVTPKLLEVTFCPANNAICDAYERDEDLYKNYNKEIFEALFLGIISDNITQLQ